METQQRLIAHWLTRKIKPQSFWWTGLLIVLVICVCLLDWNSHFLPLSASRYLVFEKNQYWRLWTALFAHSNLGHLFGNLFLFVPFAFLLMGYYSLWLFPVSGFFVGGIINALVLQTMPETTELLGISGVVNWMGAVWLVLFFLIDRRSTWRRRFAVVLFSSVVLFAPQGYEQNISYLSHLLGYLFGMFTGFLYYLVNRKKIKASEVWEEITLD